MVWWIIACAPPLAGAETPAATIEAPIAAVIAPPPVADTVGTAFPPPSGYTRVAGSAFGASLLDLRLRDPADPVRTFAGAEVGHHARVIELDLVPGDLQQCADSAIRVRAEWQRSVGQSPSFHATSGDPLPWSRFAAGERPYERDNKIAWKAGSSREWDDWLAAVFMWAGTLSLQYDTVAVAEPQPGDIVVKGGSPGHAVLLLDVAKRGDQTVVLFAEGYMPAQDFHVEIGAVDGWWAWEPVLSLPYCCDLPTTGLRRWKEPG